VNFNTFLIYHTEGFFSSLFSLRLPTATHPSINNLLCLGLLLLCHKVFFPPPFFFELFVLPLFFLHTRVCGSASAYTSVLSRVFQCQCCDGEKYRFVAPSAVDAPEPPQPLNPPQPPSPLLFSPSGQTVFMLLDERKKTREMELLLAVTF